jgi:hypothetical protein
MTMLDLLFNESVRVMRATRAGVKGDVTYVEQLDPTGGPLPVRCFLKRKARRVYGKDRVEQYLDGTLLYRVDEDLPEIRAEDIVVAETGDAFKCSSVDQDREMGTDEEYRQLGLQRTKLPTPEAKKDE